MFLRFLPPRPFPPAPSHPVPQFEHLIVNTAMLEGAKQQEAQLEAQLGAKQGQLSGST